MSARERELMQKEKSLLQIIDAFVKNKTETVILLLDRNPDKTLVNTPLPMHYAHDPEIPAGKFTGATILWAASSLGRAELVDQLLHLNASPFIPGPYGVTALEEALKQNHKSIAEKLVTTMDRYGNKGDEHKKYVLNLFRQISHNLGLDLNHISNIADRLRDSVPLEVIIESKADEVAGAGAGAGAEPETKTCIAPRGTAEWRAKAVSRFLTASNKK